MNLDKPRTGLENKGWLLGNMMFVMNTICLGFSTLYLLAVSSSMKRRVLQIFLMPPSTKSLNNNSTIQTYSSCGVENYYGQRITVDICNIKIKHLDENDKIRVLLNDNNVPYFVMLQ